MATTAMAALIRRKPGVAYDLFSDYWMEVHGPVGIRLLGPALFHYRQHHLDYAEGGAWPQVAGIDYTLPDTDRIDGVAEVVMQAGQKPRHADAGAMIVRDEPNFLDEVIHYPVGAVKAVTDDDPTDAVPCVKFLLLVKKAKGVDDRAFRKYMAERYPDPFVGKVGVVKLRVLLLDPHDDDEVPRKLVRHKKGPDEQYQAVVEVGFKDRLHMTRVLGSGDYAAAAKEQAGNIRQLHPMLVRRTYGLVTEGHVSLAAVRGHHVADLITRIGADNQLDERISRQFTP